jgi:SNF2 family DNA or RNA helicase
MNFDGEELFGPVAPKAPLSEQEQVEKDIEDKKARLAELELAMAARMARRKAIEAEQNEIKAEAARKLDLLAQERFALDESLMDERREMRLLNDELSALQKRLRMLLEAERLKNRYKEAAARFDLATAGAPWREWAMQHQIDGAHALASAERGILGDKMGLGKTLTALMTIDMLQAKRVLIVAPADVVSNFENEVKRWSPHRKNVVSYYKMTKNVRDFGLSLLQKMDEFVILINYEAWRKDAELIDRLVECRFDAIICDEAHAMKEVTGGAFKGVRKIVCSENCCPWCGAGTTPEKAGNVGYYTRCINDACGWNTRDHEKWDIADRRSVKYVFPMTGTPILNRPQELYPLLHLVFPEIFHDVKTFLSMYCTQTYEGKWIFRNGALDQLQHHLQGHYVARDRHSAGVVIPKQTVRYVDIPLDTVKEDYPSQYRFMEMLSKYSQIVLDSGDKIDALATITLIMRKRQMNVWPGGIQIKDDNGDVIIDVGDEVQESIKVDTAFRILTEVCGDGIASEGERAVVFSQFKSPLHVLCDMLNKFGISAVVYDGSTPDHIRNEVKLDFDRKTMGENPKWQVVLCNYRTGGVGLNFTGATQTIVMDEEWNPGKNEQAWGRTDRVGQTEETTVTIIRIEQTIDTWLAQLIAEKDDIVQGFESVAATSMLDAMRNGEMI